MTDGRGAGGLAYDGELRGELRLLVVSWRSSPPSPFAAGERDDLEYEIHSGRRIVSTEYSISASQTVIDDVRDRASFDAEIARLGVESVSGRGARFSAVLVPAGSHG